MALEAESRKCSLPLRLSSRSLVTLLPVVNSRSRMSTPQVRSHPGGLQRVVSRGVWSCSRWCRGSFLRDDALVADVEIVGVGWNVRERPLDN